MFLALLLLIIYSFPLFAHQFLLSLGDTVFSFLSKTWLVAGQCKKRSCKRLGCRCPVGSDMQWDEYKEWYYEIFTYITPAAFKWYSRSDFVLFCQQCCSDADNLPTETISMLNVAKKCISKRGRDSLNSTRTVDIQIDVMSLQISSIIMELNWSNKERSTL